MELQPEKLPTIVPRTTGGTTSVSSSLIFSPSSVPAGQPIHSKGAQPARPPVGWRGRAGRRAEPGEEGARSPSPGAAPRVLQRDADPSGARCLRASLTKFGGAAAAAASAPRLATPAPASCPGVFRAPTPARLGAPAPGPARPPAATADTAVHGVEAAARLTGREAGGPRRRPRPGKLGPSPGPGWGPQGLRMKLRMKLSPPPHWPLSCFLVLLPWPLATPTSMTPWHCPPGEEPNLDPGQGTLCRACPLGTFSASWGSSPCQSHSRCSLQGRLEAQAGTVTQDTVCGDCQPGWFAPSRVPHVPCQPCSWTPLGPRSCYDRRWRTRRGVEVAAGVSGTGETRQPGNSTRAGGPEETAAQYAVIAIVPIFCLMGLLGILVCNLLKRKGYHCTAHKEVGPGSGGGGSGNNPAYRAEDANEDTIGALVRLITEKKENAAALEELLKEYHSKQLVQTSHGPVPRLPPGPPSMPYICPHHHHLHTVQGLASFSGPCCSRCSQKKWPEVLLSPEAAAASTPTPRLLPNPARAPKAGAKAGRQGEITILSVGRFRVARIPEQRTNSWASEVKTITEAGPSVGDFTDSPQPGLPTEQRALLGSSGNHTKWPKPPAEKKAEENRYVVRLSESNLVI